AAIVQGYAFGQLARRFGDRRLLIAGGFGMAATIALVPALHSSPAQYAWTAVLAFSNSIFGPAATGLVSVFADPTEQGTVLGAAQARLRDYLNSVRERCTGCEALLVADARGRTGATSIGRTSAMQVPEERLNGLRTGDAFVGDPYWDAGVGKAAVVLAVPVRSPFRRS